MCMWCDITCASKKDLTLCIAWVRQILNTAQIALPTCENGAFVLGWEWCSFREIGSGRNVWAIANSSLKAGSLHNDIKDATPCENETWNISRNSPETEMFHCLVSSFVKYFKFDFTSNRRLTHLHACVNYRGMWPDVILRRSYSLPADLSFTAIHLFLYKRQRGVNCRWHVAES